jgi:hypothetical protein
VTSREGGGQSSTHGLGPLPLRGSMSLTHILKSQLPSIFHM